MFYCTYSLLNQTPAGRIFKPFPHAHTFCFLHSSHCLCPQTIPVWPLLPVLLSAVRVEEPCSDALQRPTFQMWILRPGLRWRHDAQQPHPHTHRREAVQVSNSEYPQTPIKSTHLAPTYPANTTRLALNCHHQNYCRSKSHFSADILCDFVPNKFFLS